MAASGKSQDRHQIYLVLAVTVVSLVAATVGGLVAKWGSDAEVSGQLSALETAATYETDATGPPHPALTPLSGAMPALAMSGEVYVPVYSSIYLGHRRGLSDLAKTLSVRNTSRERAMIVTAVDYVDGEGGLVRSFIETPHVLAPLGTAEFFIDPDDRRGGPGASFVVAWGAAERIPAPLIEAVMIGSYGLKSLTIVSRGRDLEPGR